MTRRSIRSSFAVGVALSLVLLALPRPAVACSCVPTQPMAAYAGEPDTVVFTGVTEPRDARGYPVSITRWFQGEVLVPRVWLAASGFDGNSASCGIDPLPVGLEFVFIAYRVPGSGELIVNLCAPHAPIGTPEGDAMVADAIATFAGGAPPSAELPPTGPPAEAADDLDAILPGLALTMFLVSGLLLAVYAITSRRRGGAGLDGPTEGEEG